jgi:hypothetical protein
MLQSFGHLLTEAQSQTARGVARPSPLGARVLEQVLQHADQTEAAAAAGDVAAVLDVEELVRAPRAPDGPVVWVSDDT